MISRSVQALPFRVVKLSIPSIVTGKMSRREKVNGWKTDGAAGTLRNKGRLKVDWIVAGGCTRKEGRKEGY